MTADPTVTFGDLIEAESGDTAETVAAGIVASLRLSKIQRHVLWPLIINEVRRHWRNAVRPLEPSRVAFEGERADPASDRSSYLSKRIAICDSPGRGGKYKEWGEFTIEDHESRIRFLESLVRGNERTISDHRDAIARIKAVPGATCLNDVEVAA